MLIYALFFVAGLIIGWNFLPQPIWVKNIVQKLFGQTNGENKNV